MYMLVIFTKTLPLSSPSLPSLLSVPSLPISQKSYTLLKTEQHSTKKQT